MLFIVDKTTPVPTLKMHGAIGKDEKVNYAAFTNALDEIKATSNKANLDIHSGGGNMGDGFAMMDAIVNSGMDISGHISGIAGSMAGVICLAIPKDKLTCSEFAQLMTHPPQGVSVGEAAQHLANAKLQTDLLNKLKAAFVTRTGLPANEIDDWFKPGVMNWMDATKMKQCNIVGAIKPATAPANTAMPDVANKTDVEAFDLYNSILDTQNLTDMAFKKTTFDEIGLPENSTGDALENRVLEIFRENKTLKDAQVAEKKKRAESLVANAISEKKIPAAEGPEYITNAITNYDFVEKVLKAKKGATLPNSKIKDVEPTNSEKKGRDEWTLTDWRQKDSAGLLTLKINQPEVYNQLLEDNLTASGVSIGEGKAGGTLVDDDGE